jgi:CHAT domain-containing protein
VRELLLSAIVCGFAVGAAAACRPATERCADLAKRDDLVKTIARCTAEFDRTRDVAAGVAAARAHAKRGDDEAVLAWADRLGSAAAAAPVWRSAANVLGKRGDRVRMLTARHNALAGWRTLRKPGEAAYEAHQIMRAHWEASELAPALEAARLGRDLALASDDHEMQLATFADMFTLLIGIGDNDGARTLLEAQRTKMTADDHQMHFYVSFYDGQLQLRSQRPATARAAYLRVLELAPAVKDPASVRSAYYNLVEIELDLGDVARARDQLAHALALVPKDAPSHARSAAAYYTALVELADKAPEKARAALTPALADDPIDDWRWQLEYLEGRTLEALNDLDGAAAAYARSIAVVERMRREIASDPLQLVLRDRRRQPYEAAFDLAARRNRTADALAVANAMWTRRFAEEFAAEPEQPGAPEQGGASDPLGARVAGLTALAPAVVTAPLIASSASATAALASDDDQASHDVIAFIEAHGAWWRYHRTHKAMGLEKVSLAAPQLASLVAALRTHPDDRDTAAKLGAALIPPSVLDDRTHTLYIVADGVLGGVPIAALIAGGRRLVEARPIAVVPSLAAIATPGAPTPPRASSQPIVLGPPSDARLAAARTEAGEVAKALGVQPYTGEAATSERLRQAATARVLHVAAHGGIDSRGAFIDLADRRVDAADVLAWHLAPHTVVLASCSSGARPGRTLWGAMGAAFLANGSAAVVASLWPVGDEDTRRLLTAFYAAGGANQPALALAQAQRQAIAEGRPVSAWASFVVLGGG